MEVPPGPKSGIIRRYFANRAVFLDELRRDYGPISYFQVGFFRVYLVTDPAQVKQVMMDRGMRKSWITTLMLSPVVGKGLLLSEGELYRRQRRLIQPVFHKKRMETYSRVAVESATQWSERQVDGQALDVEKEMMGLALDVVGRSLFGSEMGPEAQRVARALDSFYGLVDWVVALGPLAFIIPHPKSFGFLWHLFRLRRFVDKLITSRRKSESKGDDLLSLLLAAEEDGQSMSHRQARSQALTLLLAGHETTAVTMTWTWYLLSQNPECAKKLHQELEEVLEGRAPSMADFKRLTYTRKVLSESLRLYPPAYLIDRNPEHDLDVLGYTVPKGSYVFVSPYATHRDPKYFPDPLKFDPERWTEEAIKSRPLYSFFPFGVGPRACIGQSFAWMEAMLILATVASRWRMSLEPDQRIDTDPQVTLRPRYGMRMKLHARQVVKTCQS